MHSSSKIATLMPGRGDADLLADGLTMDKVGRFSSLYPTLHALPKQESRFLKFLGICRLTQPSLQRGLWEPMWSREVVRGLPW